MYITLYPGDTVMYNRDMQRYNLDLHFMIFLWPYLSHMFSKMDSLRNVGWLVAQRLRFRPRLRPGLHLHLHVAGCSSNNAYYAR